MAFEDNQLLFGSDPTPRIVAIELGETGTVKVYRREKDGTTACDVEEFHPFVWADGDDLLLDCEASAADDLIKRLSIYRLRRPITIARDDNLAVHWSPEGTDDPRLSELGRRWLAPPTEPASGYLAHRLRLGVTEGRAELGDILWLECNAAELNGVSFSKGCFVGQENTARMNWRAKVNRRLVVVEGAAPGPRTRVSHPELGLRVEHRRLDDLSGVIIPDWLQPALA